MNKDSFVFIILLIYILVMLKVSNIAILGALAIAFLLISPKIAKRALIAILLFNLSVTIGYIIICLINQDKFLNYILVFNLRVFDITFMAFFITSKINLIKVFSFNKEFKFLLSATLFQIQNFLKTFNDFKLALKSRSVKKLNQRDKKSFIEAMFFYFFKKSLHNSKERTLALKARGFFD